MPDSIDKVTARAKNNAYLLLRVRPRSESEMKRRLAMKGYAGPLIDEIVEGLKKAGDIDDARFAKFWVESRMHRNPVGDIVLKQELKEKGVSEPIIEAALDSKRGTYDEYETAFSMAEERFRRLSKLDRRKVSKRLYDFLIRRGFAYETVRRIIEELVVSSKS